MLRVKQKSVDEGKWMDVADVDADVRTGRRERYLSLWLPIWLRIR